MSIRKTKLYKTILSGQTDAILKEMMAYLKSGKDVNIRDVETGGTLLHLIVEHGERFCSPETVSVVYMLACKDIELDAQDNKGETALHKIVRKRGTYRILLAIMRCGADTTLKNNDGKTAEEVLLTEKPHGWEEMKHFYDQYKPGLWVLLQQKPLDHKAIEDQMKKWCRLTTVKNGKITSMKHLIDGDVHNRELLTMMEYYENSNEFCLALTAGLGFIVRMWIRDGVLSPTVQLNSKDHSYRFRYPDYPDVPRPVLASAWESNSYETIDVLMELGPDTRVLYSNDPEKNPPKPIFFQLLAGNSIPKDDRIVLRILRGSDLTARDQEGYTVLHTAIAHNQTENFIKILISYGVDIAARDRHGRTARDLAEKLEKTNYVKCIDEQIIKMVKDKKFEELERLILHNYDHLLDITDAAKKPMMEIAKKSGTRQMYEVIRLTAAIQAYIKRVFLATDDGSLEDLRKLLACKKYSNARDRCGRSLLHRAILRKRKEVAMFYINDHPQLVTVRDSLDRTPLHYAQLFLASEDVINLLQKNGALPELRDTRGRSTDDYSMAKAGRHAFTVLQKEVLDFDLNVYLAENNFDDSLKSAIKQGDLETVRSLISGLQAFGDVERYNKVLFDCVDNKQTDIARFLIVNGFKTDVYKQYQQCDPNDPMCAMMECGHSMSSLRERANDQKCSDIVGLIDDVANGKLKIQRNGTVHLAPYGMG